jgi:putative NADH-flavin reductase/L-ascorbate metabolism protein UlaG (beta-lactamase superfamily)
MPDFARSSEPLTIRLIGGPTAVIEYGGLRFLTDPTFDPPRVYEPRPGVTMTKRSGPAVDPNELPAIDAVLLSHDHHVDNLDESGRAFLERVPLVLTTPSGAERLGGRAYGLGAWQSRELVGPDGAGMTVTGVPAQHGPDGTGHLTGEVVGFYLSGRGLPTVYVSGDNASLDVVREIVERLGSALVAVLYTGAAQMPYLGQEYLTLSATRAAKAATILGAHRVVPIHFDGWAHFSQGAGQLRSAFAQAGVGELLQIPEPGETVTITPTERLRLAVIGGTGVIGTAISREALARGHDVTIMTRQPDTADGLARARTVTIDAASEGLTQAIVGVDAVSGRRDGRPDQIPLLARRVLEQTETAGVARLLWVGGAGSLDVVPGLRLLDTPDFPAEVRREALAQADALDVFRQAATDVDWSYFSPAQELDVDGGRARYSMAATDSLLRDEDGHSRIALADYARAALDELERPRFSRARFSIAARPHIARLAAVSGAVGAGARSDVRVDESRRELLDAGA